MLKIRKWVLIGHMKSSKIFPKQFLLISLLGIFWIGSCKQEKEPSTKETVEEKIKIITPDFNADSAYNFIQYQVNFGPRIPNSSAHKKCAAFLKNKLESYGANVIVQEGQVKAFDGTLLNIKNIIASFKPENKNRILLCSHWDTRPWADQDAERPYEPNDGANDGASGVGILLEVARLLHSKEANIGIDIIFFDAEDYGQPDNSGYARQEDTYALGSQFWAKKPHINNYNPNYGILLDMVGAPNATFAMEAYSMEFAPYIMKKVWEVAAKLGFSDYFVYKESYPIIDDHYYINTLANIPCIDIIHHDPTTASNFGTYWHTHKDNMSNIDKNTLKAVGQTLSEVIYQER